MANQQSLIESLHPAFKLRHPLRGHTDAVYRMALSPDGRILASPSEDGTVRLWDVERGQLLWILEHGIAPRCVAWSPDGQTIGSGDSIDGKHVYLWNAATGKQLQVLKGHTNTINSIAWSPDGKMLASGSDDTTIRLWDTETGRTLRELKGHTNEVDGIVWSPDGKRLCSGSWDETVRLWNVATGELFQTLTGHESMVTCVAWSPDGLSIASGSEDGVVRIWNPATGQQIYLLEGHTDQVVSVAFLHDGRLLASLAKDGAVLIWRTDAWMEAAQMHFKGNDYMLCNLAVHPTLPLLAVASQNMNEIDIWELDFR